MVGFEDAENSPNNQAEGYTITVPAVCDWPLLFFEGVVAPVLRGYGQVVFAGSSATGLLTMAALFVGDTWLGVLSLIGCVSASLLGYFLSVDKSFYTKGLAGYNGVLVGCGFAVFLNNGGAWAWRTAAATFFGGAGSVFVTMALSNMQEAPVWTFPFNIVLTVACLYVRPLANTVAPAPLTISDLSVLEVVASVATGVSQIFVLDNWLSGVLIALGLGLHSWGLAASIVAGSLVGMLVAIALGVDAAQVRDGLYGYNAALTAAAVFTFLEVSKEMVLFLVAAAAMTAVVHAGVASALGDFDSPDGTLAFCFTVSFCYTLIGKVHGLSKTKGSRFSRGFRSWFSPSRRSKVSQGLRSRDVDQEVGQKPAQEAKVAQEGFVEECV